MVRHPSLELSWLPTSMRKGLDSVNIVHTDCADYSGAYWPRMPRTYIVHGFDLRKTAVIEIAADKRYIASTLAHEFRHHWQNQHRVLPAFIARWQPATNGWDDYWAELKRYFTVYPRERDALIFETKVAPCERNLQWCDFMKIGKQ